MSKHLTGVGLLIHSARGVARGSGERGKAPPVKPREERQKVMVKARMRSGASWNDVCNLNVSLHGAGAIAMTAFGLVGQALARPLSQISAALH